MERRDGSSWLRIEGSSCAGALKDTVLAPKLLRRVEQRRSRHRRYLGRMQIPVLLDRSRREPLTSQLVDQLREAIRHARIRPSTRLPSSRRLSEQLSVSRNTVIRAYDTLIVEGYVESRPASGIFVSESLPGAPVKVMTAVEEPARAGLLSHMPLPPLPLRVQNVVDPQRNRLSFDFFPERPSAALFPVKTWRRLLLSKSLSWRKRRPLAVRRSGGIAGIARGNQ